MLSFSFIIRQNQRENLLSFPAKTREYGEEENVLCKRNEMGLV